MSAAADYAGLYDEEQVSVPSGGYIANQIVQAPSGRSGIVQTSITIAAGGDATVRTSGKYTVPCASAVVAAVGTRIWWDSANDTAVLYAPAAGFYLGKNIKAKADGETTIDVLFNEAPPEFSRVVTKTADYTVLVTDSGSRFSNVGASGTITLALPAAVPGLKVSARVGVAQQLRLDPNGSETISLPSTGVPGAAGKYLVADAIGETVDLECIVAGTWSVMGYTGTWTAEA